VPILTELLRKDNKGIATSFGAAATLYDDPVAKALSEIGEPATDSVAGLFADGDAPTRRRAAIVLSNIGTPNAREALLRQIDREPDPDLENIDEEQSQIGVSQGWLCRRERQSLPGQLIFSAMDDLGQLECGLNLQIVGLGRINENRQGC
jgi:hypothetical protein